MDSFHAIPKVKARLTRVKESIHVQMHLELLGIYLFNDPPQKGEDGDNSSWLGSQHQTTVS